MQNIKEKVGAVQFMEVYLRLGGKNKCNTRESVCFTVFVLERKRSK